VLFGTDWPGPGVPDMGGNLEQVKALAISDAAKCAILSENALKVWPEGQ
jgi:predicted TIM-barrel fold metal-dependent hydrolase